MAGIAPGVSSELFAPVVRKAKPAPAPRMRVLVVLSSSNQLYSGIGRAIFELGRRMSDRVAFEFAIDDLHAKNVAILSDFCEANGFPLHVGRGQTHPEALDAGNADLARLLTDERWDLIECVCWANTATNRVLLQFADDVPICYTPHHQPSWTVPMTPEQAQYVDSIHDQLVRRADLVLCDSPWERKELQSRVPERFNCVYLPLGCHFEAFRPGPPKRKEQLLFVGDLVEPRKRFDRVLDVFSRLSQTHPELKLVVVGNRSDQVLDRIPVELRPRCELRGYVSERCLRQAYAESAGLILMSDFEAFGIPILEALVCGTPVYLAWQEATHTLFGAFRGAHFCPGDDPRTTAAIITEQIRRGPDAIQEVLADRMRLRATFDWELLAEKKRQALAATWFRARYVG